MSAKPIKLVLDIGSPALSGHRLLKSGRYQCYDLELKACRYSVRQVLAQLRKMHLRDRERLERETARIEREQRELLQEQA
jgi:hypothetical protein